MVAVTVTLLAGVLSSLSSVVVALIKYQYHLFHLIYLPLFWDHNENKVTQLFCSSLQSHLMENVFTTIFNFDEFIFAYVVNIRFICDGEIYLLTYVLTYLLTYLLTSKLPLTYPCNRTLWRTFLPQFSILMNLYLHTS